MNKPSWHIVGQGAIGSLLAATGINSGLAVNILSRASHSGGIKFTSLNDTTQTLPDAKGISANKNIAKLIIPVKAYQVVPFLHSVVDKLTDDAIVVISHNGMGTIEQVTSLLPTSVKVFFATTSHGALKQNNSVTHTGKGKSFVGQVSGPAVNLESQEMQELLLMFPDAQFTANIKRMLWEKLIINVAINPLTAIHQVNNGQLNEQPYYTQVKEIVNEAVRVANVCGYPFVYQDLLNTVTAVIINTSNNRSSMLQDRLLNKPNELDYICGFLLNQAATKNINCRLIQQLYEQASVFKIEP